MSINNTVLVLDARPKLVQIGLVVWLVLASSLGMIWYSWIQVLLETVPDIGHGSMYRGLRNMNPATWNPMFPNPLHCTAIPRMEIPIS